MILFRLASVVCLASVRPASAHAAGGRTISPQELLSLPKAQLSLG